MTERLRDQIAFRVTPGQRRSIVKAARIAKRSVSDWARLVVTTESEIQVETKGGVYGNGHPLPYPAVEGKKVS